jgi:hypothetical protein
MKIVMPLVEKLKSISGLYISKNGQNWQSECVMGWYLQQNLVGLWQQNISNIKIRMTYKSFLHIFFCFYKRQRELYHFASAQIKA